MEKSNSSNPDQIFNSEDYSLVRQRICEILDSNKAENILVMNLNPQIGYDLYFINATALSSTHLKKLATDIIQILKKNGIFPGYVPNETDYSSGWVALDYGELIVHVFTKEKREFYNLEELWGKSLIEKYSS